jgi:hypothetical protein
MKRLCSVIAIIILAQLQVGSFFAPRRSRADAASVANDAIEYWVRANYRRTLDLVFQDRCTSPAAARWISCVLIVPGYADDLEYSLSVEKQYNGTILAHIVRPKATSIHMQLSKRKREHPRASVADIGRLIEVESQTGDQHRFPGLVQSAEAFEQIRFSPVLSDELMMDPTEYRFHARSPSGESMELTLIGPGSAAPHQPQPLIQWAESVKELLAHGFLP